MQTTIVTNSEEETRRIAAALAAKLQPGDVVALDGDLGAGKTCFVRGMAEGLGIEPREVSSPTFVICQEYGLDSPVTLVHIDAYRIGDIDELETIGFDEIATRGDTVIAIEWAERIAAALPETCTRVSFEHGGPERRTLRISGAHQVDPPEAATCAICGGPTSVDAEAYPFCSARCRWADLGRWFGGRYGISRPAEATDWEE